MKYYLKKEWKANSLAVLLQIIFAGLCVLQNLLLIQVLQGIIDLDMHDFLRWALLDLAVCAAMCGCSVLQSRAQYRAVRFMNNRLRADITATMLRMSHQEYHARQSGEYLSWLSNDVHQIEANAWNNFYSVVSTVSQIVFSVAALATMHWSLLAASLAAALILIAAPKLVTRKVEGLAERCAEEQGQATGKLKDLLAGLDVLRSFGREDRFLRDSKAASDGLEQPKYRLSSARAAVGGGIAVVSATCQLLVLLLVGALSIAGLIAQSAILGCGNLCSAIYNGLGRLGELHVGIRASKPYFEKITVHAGEPAVESGDDFLPVRHGIAVENLSFRYGEKPVLENASFRFDQGGKYALTGPSGCGKSTLLKLLLGWLPDYSGTIRFDGRDARDLTPEQLQRQMSYIEQDVFLFNTTIRENITLGDAFSEEALAQAVRDSALEGDLANMPQGLNTPVGEDGGNLSGGQKQRVAIARALLHRRSILLVDEGTSALDQKNADIVEQSLLENPDLTLILVSHHLSPARKAQFTKVYQLSPAELCTT